MSTVLFLRRAAGCALLPHARSASVHHGRAAEEGAGRVPRGRHPVHRHGALLQRRGGEVQVRCTLVLFCVVVLCSQPRGFVWLVDRTECFVSFGCFLWCWGPARLVNEVMRVICMSRSATVVYRQQVLYRGAVLFLGLVC